VLILTKKWIGRFLNKLIWSPCLQRKVLSKSVWQGCQIVPKTI
jgi:hypothetical protein